MAHQRIDEWTGWIDGTINNNVLAMHLQRAAWLDVAEILQNNADQLPDSYWDSCATATRRRRRRVPDDFSTRRLSSALAIGGA